MSASQCFFVFLNTEIHPSQPARQLHPWQVSCGMVGITDAEQEMANQGALPISALIHKA